MTAAGTLSVDAVRGAGTSQRFRVRRDLQPRARVTSRRAGAVRDQLANRSAGTGVLRAERAGLLATTFGGRSSVAWWGGACDYLSARTCAFFVRDWPRSSVCAMA